MSNPPIAPHIVVALVAMLGIGVPAALAQNRPAAPAAACEKIKAACERAGFVEGGGAEGKGLWPDCLTPIMEGRERPSTARPLPEIGPGLKEACLVERPEFARSPMGTPAPLPVLKVTSSAPTVFMTPEQMQGYGFAWGPSDGPFGAIPLGEGRYRFFGGAHGGRQCPRTAQRTGVFAFTGTLDRVTGGDGCGILIGGGDPPAGWVFDANYASGGQLMRFAAEGRTGFLMTFRGEYHWPNPARPDHLCGGGPPPFDVGVPCYYSTLGLAVSTDGGRSFRVAGESLQLSDPLSATKGSAMVRNIGYGSLVVADANGRHLSTPPPDPKAAYIYLFFVASGKDLPGVCTGAQCPGVARARYEDVVSAVLSGKPHAVAKVFHKYDAAAKDDPWSQAATGDSPDLSIGGGKFSPLYLGQGIQIVVYDRAFDVYLGVAVSFATGSPAFVIRASADLIHWSEPIGPPIADGKRSVGYVTLLGETSDPSIAGEEPRLYFSSTDREKKGPQSSAFKVVRLRLSRQ